MTGLHAVTQQEANEAALRAEALRRFKARYRHNPESQRAMVGALRRIAQTSTGKQHNETTFPWDALIDEDLAGQVWSAVADIYARATVVKDASALRVMLDCCRKVGLMEHDEYARAVTFDAKGGHVTATAGHYLSETDVGKIVGACRVGGNPNTKIRDVALILTLASSGARGDEVANIRLEDLHLEERRVWLRKTKSGQPRDAWLHPAAVVALTRWLEVRGSEGHDLFVPLSRTGRPLGLHGAISTHQVWKVVGRRAAQVDLSGITPHDLRRFVITTLLENGIDIALIAKTVGHKNPTTTAGYDKRPGERQRDAVAQIQLPTLEVW